jgi:hypothetical protein
MRYFLRFCKHEVEWSKRYYGRNRKANPELDAEVIRLREEKRFTYGQLAIHISDVTGKPCTYNKAAKMYRRAKERASGRSKKL